MIVKNGASHVLAAVGIVEHGIRSRAVLDTGEQRLMRHVRESLALLRRLQG